MTSIRAAGAAGLGIIVAGMLAGCAAMQAPPEPSLYKRLGGRHGIAVVVDDFMAIAAGDPRVSARVKAMPAVNLALVKSHLADQICQLTGGPCAYLGPEPRSAARGLNLTEGEWSAAVEDFIKALDKNRISAGDQQELLATLAPMKQQIVGQ
jgi:hemoglobin